MGNGRWNLASLSAGPFEERGINSKRHKVNVDEAEKTKESMSERTPWSSIVHFLPLIAE